MKRILDILQDYDLIVEIRNFKFTESDWQIQYLQALSGWDKYIFDAGEIKIDDADYKPEFAHYQFFEASEIEKLEDKINQPCEFNNRLLGYFCFRITFWDDWRDKAENFIIGNLKESMGLFIGRNLKEQAFVEIVSFPCVKLQRYDAELSKYKFDDGAELLSRTDEKYCDYVIETIKKALHAKDLYPMIFVSISCHNPFHFGIFELHNKFYEPAIFDAAGKIVPEKRVSPILQKTFIELWTFDFTIVQSVLNNCEASTCW